MSCSRALTPLLLLLALGCARNPATENAATLARGLTALASGDHLVAERYCLDAATADRGSQDAQECVLLAAVNLHHWQEAASAVARLTALSPDDAWLAAVEVQVRQRHDPSLQLAPRLDRPEMAWACMDVQCGLPESPLDHEMRFLASLHQVHIGDGQSALALSERRVPGSPLDDLYLLVLAGSHDFPTLRRELAGRRCGNSGEPTVTNSIRQVLAPDLQASGGCEADMSALAARPGSAAADLNQALAAMRAGDHAVAGSWLARCIASAPDSDVPLLYAVVNAFLAQDDDAARRLLLALPADLPTDWRDWLRKLPYRRLL